MATPVKRAPGRSLTTVGDPTTQLVFGVVFDLHGTKVPVSTADIANAVDNGIEFTLPEPVDLGTLNDFSAWLKTQFGVDVPTAAQLPTPLNKVVALLTSLDVTVSEFHIKVPGTKSEVQSTQFTLGMKAMWAAGQGIPLIPNVLTIDGCFLGATNEKKAAA